MNYQNPLLSSRKTPSTPAKPASNLLEYWLPKSPVETVFGASAVLSWFPLSLHQHDKALSHCSGFSNVKDTKSYFATSMG